MLSEKIQCNYCKQMVKTSDLTEHAKNHKSKHKYPIVPIFVLEQHVREIENVITEAGIFLRYMDNNDYEEAQDQYYRIMDHVENCCKQRIAVKDGTWGLENLRRFVKETEGK